MRVDLLIFCPVNQGGLADYAHEQANAIADRGQRVLLLVPADFPYRSASYQRCHLPTCSSRTNRPRWRQQLGTAMTILRQQAALNRVIKDTGVSNVLFTTYSEYLAPLWAWRLRRWVRCGVSFGAVAHDPVRDFVVGPLWWHRLSISQGYSFLNIVFVHANIQLDTAASQQQPRTQLIPHGPYRYPTSSYGVKDLRQRMAIPADAPLLLSFGHLRDNKNLNLILLALSKLPEAWLLVAGPEATAGQKPAMYYRQLAESLGVAQRCRWHISYQTAQQVADNFTACDAVLLCYSSQFRSASGVMHLAAHYQKPVIASAGDSALLDIVSRFGLGVVVKPDDSDALLVGIRRLLSTPLVADWEAYECSNSWARNAQLVSQAFGLEPIPKDVHL